MISYIILLFSVVMFFTAFHNIDLMINYATIYNDVNQENYFDGKFYNIRDITDCTVTNHCPDYKTIYLRSVGIMFISYFLLLFLVISLGIEKWIRKKYQ